MEKLFHDKNPFILDEISQITYEESCEEKQKRKHFA